ncbi:hypothetical protein [Methylobacterium crusticola]|nr:hypothetical protein [Methylobacterium crusticola]
MLRPEGRPRRDIGPALRGTVQNISTQHSPSLGFGVLDAAAFVAAV